MLYNRHVGKVSIPESPPCAGEPCASCVAETAPAPPRRRSRKAAPIDFPRFADMLSAMGTEPRLRIMHGLLTAHPTGLVVGDIQSELEIAPSTGHERFVVVEYAAAVHRARARW